MIEIGAISDSGFSNGNSKTKIIKRYRNRKLYNTHQSCYLTLEDIAKMVRANEDVKVIENKSQKDITSATLTMIAFNAEKKEPHGIPLAILLEIIRYGNGTLSGYLAKLGAFSKDDFEQQNALNLAQQATHVLNRNIDQHEEVILGGEATNRSVSRNAATLALRSQVSNSSSSFNELEAPDLPTSSLSNI